MTLLTTHFMDEADILAGAACARFRNRHLPARRGAHGTTTAPPATRLVRPPRRPPLPDRKAILSHGTVRCVGSSLFLKNRFGLGYLLNVVRTEPDESGAATEAVSAVVRSVIPDALVERDMPIETTFRLPLAEIDRACLHGAGLSRVPYGGLKMVPFCSRLRRRTAQASRTCSR